MLVFRVDSSTQIGIGHLMRCLALAEGIRDNFGETSLFISRDLPGSLHGLVLSKGHQLRLLPYNSGNSLVRGYESWLGVPWKQDALETMGILSECKDIRCLVVDHYGLDARWEQAVRPCAKTIMAVDDLANRRHDVDILLDSNMDRERENPYRTLVPASCQCFLGLSFLPLRKEFRMSGNRKKRTPRTVLVAFGGSDENNNTLRVLRVLRKMNEIAQVHAVVGGASPYRQSVADFCKEAGYVCHVQVDYMARLMMECDISIGAGGTMVWERCYLGLPTIVLSIAENQEKDCALYHERQFIYYLGRDADVDDCQIKGAIRELIGNHTLYHKIQQKGYDLFPKDQFFSMLRVMIK